MGTNIHIQNKIVLITGGTGGIGKQTALALAKMGARVIVTGRNKPNGEAAVSELKQLSGNQQIDLLTADLSTQTGLAAPERQLTEDRIESNFAVNVITPFMLTHLLMDRLKSSSSARVVTLTGGEHPAKIEVDNLQAERSFMGLNTYSHAKLIMMAVMYEFAQRMQGTNVTINVCYPGQASTRMTQSVTPQMAPFILRLLWPLFKLATRADGGQSAAKASRSSVYLASSTEVEGINGKYFDTNSKMVNWPMPVLDPSTRQHLWVMVEKLSRISYTKD
ncbi:MAG: SDR family NAD(P)-dependent oxidoreductase [Chloroflexi bacterium]|nr:SDR family NAD(P)-dependent oxidoreductase [Chloroflexota bacterium]